MKWYLDNIQFHHNHNDQKIDYTKHMNIDKNNQVHNDQMDNLWKIIYYFK